MLCIWAKRAVQPSVGPELNTGLSCSFGPDAEHGTTQHGHTVTSLQWWEMRGGIAEGPVVHHFTFLVFRTHQESTDNI